ncbi:MAG TPA: hypothetical protein PKX91_06260 [Clostridia bacterium]|jgi:hypothetical protein|nr:hypothetical protein [Clostridia bacterium]
MKSILALSLMLASARPPTRVEIIVAIVMAVVAVILLIVILLLHRKKRNLKGVDSKGNVVILDSEEVSIPDMRNGQDGRKRRRKKPVKNRKQKWFVVSDETSRAKGKK